MKDYLVLIVSHKRANNIRTIRSMIRAGFTGNYKIVIDNLDPTIEEYQKLHPGLVHVFDKKKYGEITDIGDNSKELKGVTYARNACFDIAEHYGYKYFLVLDDDYSTFDFRFGKDLNYNCHRVKNLDKIFENYFQFLADTNVDCIAFSQGGDFIGGQNSTLGKSITTKRKIMQTFFCSTERKFKFVGRINEDVNTYCLLGRVGKIFLTSSQNSVEQAITQSNPGGLTEIYLDSGTYIKSFYTVIYCPSFACARYDVHMGRIHHRISWNNAVPKILSERCKKQKKYLKKLVL